MKLAGTLSVKRSFRQGLGGEVTKVDVITREEEQLLLASTGASLTHPKGLNNRFAYLLCRNLFIRGHNELRVTNTRQFELHVDEQGDEYER